MAGQDLEQLEFLYFVDGNEKWFYHFEKQFCSLLKTHTYKRKKRKLTSNITD